MKDETVTIRSTVKSDLKRKLLFRGTLLALIGFLPLLYGGTMVPAETLQYVGLPLFAFGMFMIAVGLIPYRRICRLEEHPYELIISAEFVQYKENGKLLLSIPIKAIDTVHPIQNGSTYGIGMKLKKPSEERVVVHEPIDIDKLQKKTLKNYKTDLYFPYFSEQSCWRLKSFL